MFFLCKTVDMHYGIVSLSLFYSIDIVLSFPGNKTLSGCQVGHLTAMTMFKKDWLLTSTPTHIPKDDVQITQT